MKDKKRKDKKPSSNPFIRGSQIFAHAVRMTTLGLRNTILVSLCLVVVWFLFQCWRKLLPMDLYYLAHIIWCEIKLTIGPVFYPINSIGISFYDFITQQNVYMSALEFKSKIWQGQVGQRLLNFGDWFCDSALFESIIVFALSVAMICIFFIIQGRKKMVKDTVRGAELIKPEELAKKIKRAGQASDISIAGLPLIKKSERYHMLITGSTGTGKTNLLHELLQQLEAKGDKVIIFDFNASLTGIYYNPVRGDHLLNPFDQRSVCWLPWIDCTEDYDYDALAGAFITDEALTEKHWPKAAKQVFAEALRKTESTQSISELVSILNTLTLGEYSAFFADTLVASSTDIKGGKGTSSVRSTLSTEIHKLSYLQETSEPFSIKDYVINNENNNWLFVTAKPTQREALGPLLTSWLNIALNGLMERDANRPNQNVWFIVDELTAIKKIPALKTMLSESRKYGGCFVAGIQDVNQLFDTYSYYSSLSLLNQFNTRFMFRANDQDTAQKSSEIMGQQEIDETKESVSYGSNTIRDGVNLNPTNYIKKLVLPSEFMRLADFSCYVKLKGDFPATKLKTTLQKVESKAPMFVSRNSRHQSPKSSSKPLSRD